MRQQCFAIFTASLLCLSLATARADDPSERPSTQETAWITVTIPSGVNPALHSESADLSGLDGEAKFTGLTKVKASGFEMQLRGVAKVTFSKPGQATVIRVLQAEDSVRLIIPNSRNLAFEGGKVTYNTESQSVELTDGTRVRLPNGIVAEMRQGTASSSALKKGEPVELRFSPEPSRR